MPLYEYQCESCDHRFERIQKYVDPPIDTCPNCGGKTRKLFSSPAIQFKGTGWYITDYARKGSNDGGKGGGKSDAQASDAASEKAEKAEKAGTPEKSDKGDKGDKGDKAGKSDGGGSSTSSTSETSSAKPEAKAESK